MPFRRTTGIVSNLPSSDPKTEADLIMTAAALGFAASYIEKDQPIQFDMDPLDVHEPEPTVADIATYTHGMIQAIYKAIVSGPVAPRTRSPSAIKRRRWPHVFPARSSWWPRDTLRTRFTSVEANRGLLCTHPTTLAALRRSTSSA